MRTLSDGARAGWRVLLASVAAFWGATAWADETPLLDAMFQDHAVIQRDRPIQVWGAAAPRARVTIELAGRRASARADSAGRWRSTLPAVPAGGPHTLRARTRDASQTLSDILVGDVWLCSGQSNMELPVSRVLNAEREIARSTDDYIRLMTIAHASSAVFLEKFPSPVAWRAATPETVQDFSATCYFFARELSRSVDVPMGLISASWGGSGIETWIGEAGLRALGGYDERLDLLALHGRDTIAANRRMGAMWESWWRTKSNAAPWLASASYALDWRAVPEPMRDWKTWGVPELVNHNGMVWFLCTVTLTPEQATQQASLALGGMDEIDQTWVNGIPIGNTFGWGSERIYQLPPGTLRAGENTIVVNVLSTWDAGGMYGPAERMALRFADGDPTPLGGDWRYQIAPLSSGHPPRAPWGSIGGLTTLHNAMIAPIGPYGVRGILWYQGESNTGDEQYQALLGGLMADWRAKFAEDTPFFVVQLPNFGLPPAAPTASDWASLREAQRRAVAADPRAGLAVTIDIGDRAELHPPNKQDVGRRLARAARRIAYGEAITASGPRPLDAQREAGRVVVTFADVEGQLVAYNANEPIGFELCGADQASCRFVRSVLGEDRVTLDGDGAAATRVRFCWGDGPICNLYDQSGLPAGPFEIDVR